MHSMHGGKNKVIFLNMKLKLPVGGGNPCLKGRVYPKMKISP